MKRILIFSLVLFGLMSNKSNAQSKKPITQLVKFDKNIESPLTTKEKQMLIEVYSDKLDEYIMSNPRRLKNMKHLLRNRLKVIKMDSKIDNDKYENLANISLFDIYNDGLQRNRQYNSSTFNPLKYDLPFFKIGGSIFKIYDTNYFLVIKSQTIKK